MLHTCRTSAPVTGTGCRLPRLFTLVLLLGCLLATSAADESWLDRYLARLTMDSPQSSYLLARSCPTPDFTAYISFTARKPGTLLDTVGINAAPVGSWALQVDDLGSLAFSIYSPQQRTAQDTGNGWHRYELSAALQFGQEYNCILECSGGNLLLAVFVGEDTVGMVHEALPCAVDSAAVYAGDFPGDNSWGAEYQIYRSFAGRMDVLYFGPLIDALSTETIKKTWVDPALQGYGRILVTTAEDTQDWQQGQDSATPAAGEAADDGLFSLDYDLGAADKSHYGQDDCIEALLTASPLYGGAVSGPGLRTGEIDGLRRGKVAEINSLVQEITGAVQGLQPGIKELQSSYALFLKTALQRDPSLNAYVSYTLTELAGLQAQTTRGLEQTAKLAAMSGNALADANAQYVRLVNAVMLGSTCLEHTDCLCLYAAMPLNEYSGSSDQALAQAAADLDRAMERYDKLGPQLMQLAHTMAGVDFGLQQLEAADYYVGKAGLEFMAQHLDTLAQQLDSAAPRPGASAEQLAQARATLRYNRLMHEVLSEALENAPLPELAALAHASQPCAEAGPGGLLLAAAYILGLKPAMAQGSSSPSARELARLSMQNLRDYADLPKDPENPTYWEQIKQGLRKANNDINQTLDFKNACQQWGKAFDYGRREIGKVIDKAGADIHAVARTGYGMYYGNSPEEVAGDIAENYKQMLQNQAAGQEGTNTLRTAKSYMEGAENLADQAAKDFIAKTFGGTITPWVAGKIAKGLANVFTGLAKGLYTVLAPTSTAGETAVGFAEIVLAGAVGNTAGYGEGLAAFKSLLTKALGLNSMQECLKVVLGQYKEDLGKAVLGDLTDSKSLLEAFCSFVGIDPKMLEEFSYDGNYVGTIDGGAVGKIAFTIVGSTWQGSFSGVIPWTIEGTTLAGELPFSGALAGTFNKEDLSLEGKISGTAGKQRFDGQISGDVIRDQGGISLARGTWSGSNEEEAQSGSWSAKR